MEKPDFITPEKPGYVFSHWSEIAPNGTVDQTPFDFDNKVIIGDTTLYAVFVPKVTVTFKSEGNTCGTEELMSGGKAYDPLSNNIVAGPNKPSKEYYKEA